MQTSGVAAEHPFVSIVLPCLNEEASLARCIDSLLANDYPSGRWELLIVDGGSSDGTREIAERYAHSYPHVRMLDNPKRTFAAGINIGLRHARGEFIGCFGAHATYVSDHLSVAVELLRTTEAASVGGPARHLPRDPSSVVQRTLTAIVSHPFGAGNARFRTGVLRQQWADTVFVGIYRRRVFGELGGFDESLGRGSDMEFNKRMRHHGGRILMDPRLLAIYYPETGGRSFAVKTFRTGYWVFRGLRYGRRVFLWRHVAPSALVLVLTASLPSIFFSPWAVVPPALYGSGVVVASLDIARRLRSPSAAFVSLVGFPVRHLAYGLGALWALTQTIASRGGFRGTARALTSSAFRPQPSPWEGVDA